MRKTIECPECGEDIIIYNNYIENLSEIELQNLIITETVQEDLKYRAIKILYENLTLEQLDNLVKQFVKII